jgi:hypothetical protein
MKNLLKLVLLLSLFLSQATFAQKNRATIMYKDGKKEIGYAKLISKSRVKFKATLDA